MLEVIGVNSVEQLIEETVPENIRLKEELKLPKAVSEYDFLAKFKTLTLNNKVNKSYIGLGYYNTIVPEVIKRNVLENQGGTRLTRLTKQRLRKVVWKHWLITKRW